MTKRILITLILSLAIVLAPLGPAGRAQSNSTPKAEVEKRLNKRETRVKVKLRNGSEVKGRITQSSENGFRLTDEKTGNPTDIAYADVLSVEGRGMSKKKKILIATALLVGVAITALVIALKDLDDFDLSGISIR